MAGASVALAIDGWTSVHHRKFFNLLIIHNKKPVFWRTIPAKHGKFSRVLYALVQSVMLDIEKTLSCTVCSIVADNENANRG